MGLKFDGTFLEKISRKECVSTSSGGMERKGITLMEAFIEFVGVRRSLSWLVE